MDSMYSFYIKEVVDQLNDLLLKLNHEKGMDEGRQRLLEMATSIEQFPQDIVSSQRIATEKTTIQVEQDGNIGDFRISKGKTKLNLYLLTDLIIISKLKQRGLVNKTNKEIYMTTIMHDSIRGLYRVSSFYIRVYVADKFKMLVTNFKYSRQAPKSRKSHQHNVTNILPKTISETHLSQIVWLNVYFRCKTDRMNML